MPQRSEQLPEAPLIDLGSAKALLRGLSPDVEWLLRHIESEDGHLRFPLEIAQTIRSLNIDKYPRLYEREAAIGAIFLQGFLPPEEVAAMDAELVSASPDDRGAFLRSFVEELESAFQGELIPKTRATRDAAAAAWRNMPEAERQVAVRMAQHAWMAFLAGFYQLLSVMVHGEKLTALVDKAIRGDDEAFVKAVQIDKGVLTEIPYFVQRFRLANLQGDIAFIDALTYRLKCAPYKGKIRHKPVWLALAMLDMCGWLQRLTRPELLDVLAECGLTGYRNRLEDEGALSKVVSTYRRFQRSGLAGLSTH